MPHLLGDIPYALRLDDADGKSSESGDVLRAVAHAYPALIFIIVPVEDVVAAVLNGPVTTVYYEQARGVGFVRWSTGDTIGDLARGLAVLLPCGMPFNGEGLSHMREVEVVIEFSGGPNLPYFDSFVVRGIIGDTFGFLTLLEVQGNVVQEGRLILFDGKVVMGFARNHVACNGALGQEGIGTDVLAFDGDGVKERDGAFNLICPFGFFIAYPKTAYFFWVCEVFVS